MDLANSEIAPYWMDGDSRFLLGTDGQGRDLLSVILYGTRLSLTIGIFAVLIQSVLGICIGLMSGYFGGRLDNFLMRCADIQLSFSNMMVALILISHDLGVVSRVAERTIVMYAGRIVEQGPTLEIINDPQHPYTQGLLNALPQMSIPGQRLNQIKGAMPSLTDRPRGCSFHTRCPYAMDKCKQEQPEFLYNGISHVACFMVEDMMQEESDVSTLDFEINEASQDHCDKHNKSDL